MKNKDEKATCNTHRNRAFFDIEPTNTKQNTQDNYFSLKTIGFFALGAAALTIGYMSGVNPHDNKPSKLPQW